MEPFSQLDTVVIMLFNKFLPNVNFVTHTKMFYYNMAFNLEITPICNNKEHMFLSCFERIYHTLSLACFYVCMLSWFDFG